MHLLMLRGLIRDRRSWGDFPGRFAAHAPRMTMHFLDLPGVGTENARPCPSSIPAIRIEVAKRFHEAIARGTLPAGPWSILASGLGGMVALDWAGAEPDLFRRLVLLGVSTADVASPTERFSARLLPAALASLLLNRPAFSERIRLGAVSNRFARRAGRDPKLEAIFADQVKALRERPVSRATAIRHFLSAASYRIPAERPKPKTLLISGAGDRVVDPRACARLADRLGAARLSHPWAGHDVALDDPEWLAREVSDWMGTPA